MINITIVLSSGIVKIIKFTYSIHDSQLSQLVEGSEFAFPGPGAWEPMPPTPHHIHRLGNSGRVDLDGIIAPQNERMATSI